MGPQVVTNNHDGDLCDALKESLDVLVGAGALSCETLPEEFPENLKSFCAYSGIKLYQNCTDGNDVQDAIRCFDEVNDVLSLSPPLAACNCHAMRESMFSVFSVSFLHCHDSVSSAVESIRYRGGRGALPGPTYWGSTSSETCLVEQLQPQLLLLQLPLL